MAQAGPGLEAHRHRKARTRAAEEQQSKASAMNAKRRQGKAKLCGGKDVRSACKPRLRVGIDWLCLAKRRQRVAGKCFGSAQIREAGALHRDDLPGKARRRRSLAMNEHRLGLALLRVGTALHSHAPRGHRMAFLGVAALHGITSLRHCKALHSVAQAQQGGERQSTGRARRPAERRGQGLALKRNGTASRRSAAHRNSTAHISGAAAQPSVEQRLQNNSGPGTGTSQLETQLKDCQTSQAKPSASGPRKEA